MAAQLLKANRLQHPHMIMKAFVANVAIAFAVVLGVGTAGAVPRLCPTVSVTCPDGVVIGETLTFTATVSGDDQKIVPTYNWTVSAGSITSGQGTPTIQVDATGVSDTTVTATVHVGGFDRMCSTTTSCSTGVRQKVTATKVGVYPEQSVKTDDLRLDSFAREIRMDPQCLGYIIAYGGRIGLPGEARKAADAARTYLIKHGTEASALVTIDGGFRENFTVELWIVPNTATPPTASPTVDPSEVKLPAPASKPPGNPAAKRRKKRN